MKLLRHIAGEELDKRNRKRWEGVLNEETDQEFGLIREAKKKKCAEGGEATKGKMDRRQERTDVQAAGDASERAGGALRRARKGWDAPRIKHTLLLEWHDENWAKWGQELDHLMSEAAKYEIGTVGRVRMKVIKK